MYEDQGPVFAGRCELMAEYTAIADVSESLVGLLRDRIDDRSDVLSIEADAIAAVSPADVDGDIRLTLWPYHLVENETMNNGERRQIETDRVQDPPLALDLYYLLTAFPADEADGTTDQQRLLGLAMQVFYDNAVLTGSELAGSLGEDLELRVSLERRSIQDRTALWNTFPEVSFQPSVTYHVSPVLIDSRQEAAIDRVTERETGVARTDPESSPLEDSPPPDDGPQQW